MNKKTTRYITLVLLVLWMGVIFYFSSQQADISGNTSSSVVEKLIASIYSDYYSLDNVVKQVIIDVFTAPVRTAAHFFEFFVLGTLFYVFYNTFEGFLSQHRAFITAASGLICAISDEVHQLFVPNRACQILDMAVDFCGVLLSLLICKFVMIMWRAKKGGQ